MSHQQQTRDMFSLSDSKGWGGGDFSQKSDKSRWESRFCFEAVFQASKMNSNCGSETELSLASARLLHASGTDVWVQSWPGISGSLMLMYSFFVSSTASVLLVCGPNHAYFLLWFYPYILTC